MNRFVEHLLEQLYLHAHEVDAEAADIHPFTLDPEQGDDLEALRREAEVRLVELGYALRRGDRLLITEKGERAARDLTRRYRLAERLLHDLLQIEGDEVAQNACLMEHVLSASVTDSICTLLGHPPVCPHGRPIPPGACCERAATEVQPVVVSLREVPVGTHARITFIASNTAARIHRLATMGINSGNRLRLVQRHPSVVVETSESAIALDDDVAREIFVRIESAG